MWETLWQKETLDPILNWVLVCNELSTRLALPFQLAPQVIHIEVNCSLETHEFYVNCNHKYLTSYFKKFPRMRTSGKCEELLSINTPLAKQ